MIPITTALNMRAVQSEREIDRTPGAKTVDGTTYALLHKKGAIAVTNLQKERATMRVSLSTAGKVERASKGGAVVVDELDRVNNQSSATWELTLGAGESVSLEYELSVYR
jgi:hypothetical protein